MNTCITTTNDNTDDHEINKTTDYSDIEWLEENCYFFKLSNWRDKLLKFYKKNPCFVKPEKRKNEVVSLIKSGLKDLCITRSSFQWGINVPKHEEHILYVWFEALLNYLSLIKKNNITWPANLHIIGKDILKFHAIYWPAILMASKLKLPKTIFAHGWWLTDGKKISKSTGNIIDPYEIKNLRAAGTKKKYEKANPTTKSKVDPKLTGSTISRSFLVRPGIK